MFIEGCFTTAVQVEVLLLLHRDKEQAWSATAVSRELRIDPEHASAAMAHLASNELLLSADGGYRMGPLRKRDSELVDAVAALYPSYRVAIISIIFSKPSGPIVNKNRGVRGRRKNK